MGENLPQVRRSVYEQRLLYWSLGIGLVVGLTAHVGGYLLRSSVRTEPLVLAYEAAQRDEARAGSGQALGDDAAPTAR